MARSYKKVLRYNVCAVARGNEKRARKAQSRVVRRKANEAVRNGGDADSLNVKAICNPWDRPGDGHGVQFATNDKIGFFRK